MVSFLIDNGYVMFAQCLCCLIHIILLSHYFMSAQGSKENTHQELQVPTVEEKIFTDEELNTLIDPILQSDDLNKDGFIDYPGNVS